MEGKPTPVCWLGEASNRASRCTAVTSEAVGSTQAICAMRPIPVPQPRHSRAPVGRAAPESAAADAAPVFGAAISSSGCGGGDSSLGFRRYSTAHPSSACSALYSRRFGMSASQRSASEERDESGLREGRYESRPAAPRFAAVAKPPITIPPTATHSGRGTLPSCPEHQKVPRSPPARRPRSRRTPSATELPLRIQHQSGRLLVCGRWSGVASSEGRN